MNAQEWDSTPKKNAAPGEPGHGSFGKREDTVTLAHQSQESARREKP